jgi:hypothetical protein
LKDKVSVCSWNPDQRKAKFPRVKLIQTGLGGSFQCGDKVAQKHGTKYKNIEVPSDGLKRRNFT